MGSVYKASEWQNASGVWCVNNTSDLGGMGSQWWVPARILGVTPAEYIEWLINNYKPDYIHYGKILSFYWNNEHYALAHKYLLDINKIARQKNFII